MSSVETSTPRSTTLPSVGSMSLSTSLPVVVFPHPLSPARHSTSPLMISKLMPSTAFTYSSFLNMKPLLLGNHFFRSLTTSSSVIFSPPGEASP